MSPQHSKQSVALSSVFASALLTILKLVVGVLTGSMGILSEAAHSFLDFGAASLTYFAVRIGDKPPDVRHPFGHAKVESVSALIETGLLFITSAWIIYEAIRRLLFATFEVEATWYAFTVIFISIVVDFSRSRALSKVAKETGSQALEADALHFSSDILSSFVVLAGLVFVSLGIQKADAIAALGVSLFVLHAGYSLGKRTIDVLIDAAPEGLTERILQLTRHVEGVVGIDKIRVRPVGATAFVDMVVSVSRKLPLEKVQYISNSIEDKIHKLIPEADVTVRTQPLHLDNETIVERVQIAASNHNLSVHDIVVHTLESKKYLSFDLEVHADLAIIKAHQLASHLENAIRDEIGNIEINTHIEPLRPEAVAGKSIPQDKEKLLGSKIKRIAKELPLVKSIHDVKVREIKGKYFVTVHCLFNNNTPLEDVHNSASRFEYLVKETIPETQRVIVHTEPIASVV